MIKLSNLNNSQMFSIHLNIHSIALKLFSYLIITIIAKIHSKNIFYLCLSMFYLPCFSSKIT